MYNGPVSTGTGGDFDNTKTSSKKLSRLDVLMCEQSEGWKNKFSTNFKGLFEKHGISKNHIVSSKFQYALCPIQEKREKNTDLYTR